MAEPGEPLSERELDVLRCVSRGASNKEIASDLSISENTVKVHLRNIFAKLEVSSRTEATTAAIHQRYITVPGQEGTADFEDPELASPTEVPPGTSGPAADPLLQTAGPQSDNASSGSMWRNLVVSALLLTFIAIAALVGWQMLQQNQVSATPELFAESPIENTRWLRSRPMREGRADMAVASVGLDVYQIGGETANGVDGVVRAFNSRDLTWRDMAGKPTPVAGASAAELYGEIYVPGGRLATGELSAAVEAYSPAQNAWRPIAALPSPLTDSLTLSDGSFLYVLGGYDGDTFLDTGYVYDPAADSWRPLPPLPTARAFASGGTLTGQLYVVGGQNENGALADCQRYDPAAEAWSDCPPLLAARSSAGSAVLLNRLYIIGGSAEGDGVTFSEMYDPTTATWQVINTPSLAEAAGWPDLGVGQVETRIYALGGRQDEVLLDTTFVFAPLVYQTYIPAASSADNE